MTIDLKPEQERVIEMAVQSGAYRNSSEVLDQAFEIIREQVQLQEWMVEQRETIVAQVAAGFAQAERGELTDAETAIESLRQSRIDRQKP